MAIKEPRKPAAAPTRVIRADAPDVPAWTAPVLYACVTLLLFYPFLLGGTPALGVDSIGLSYFARNFFTEFVQTFHRMPHWNPLLYGGLPFVEGMHGDIFYPPSLALFFMDARVMWAWKMALHIFFAGIFTYLWLRRGLGLDRLPALFGGLVFMMGADLVSLLLPGGDGKLFVSALAPLVFWLAERAASRQRPADFAIFALGVALTLFTSHMQAAYFCVWGVSLYFLFRVWQLWRADRNGARAAKLVGMFALAGVLGVGAAAVQFLPPLAYLREYSHRAEKTEPAEGGYAYSTGFSLHPEEIVALAVPEFVGDLPDGYWGRNILKSNNEYAGLVPLLFLPLLLWRRRTPQVWFFTGLAVLTLLYALGANTPAFRLFYLIPGVRLFRAPSIIIFLYGLSIATLGAIAVQQLQSWLMDARADSELASARRALWAGAVLFGVLALLAASGVLTSAWAAVFASSFDGERLAALKASVPHIQRGFWIAFALALLVAATWHLASRNVFSARVFVLLLMLLAAADLYRADRPFLRETRLLNESVEETTLMVPDDVIMALQRLRDAGGVFRVADLAPMVGERSRYNHNDFAVHGIEQLGGHHGNEMGRYRSLIGGSVPMNLFYAQMRLADVTNTEYFVIPGLMEDPRLEEVFVGTRAAIYRNRDALPRAYLVGSVEVEPVNTIERMLAPEFDARNTALLEEPLPADIEVQAGATGTVEWVERGTDSYTLRVAADRPALLMVLDNYYPAWEATVDDRPVRILRANHTFRAIPVPAGEHTVVFNYNAADLRTGALISLIVMTLLLLVIAGDAWHARRQHAAAVVPA